MDAHLRDHECDRRIKFADVSDDGSDDRKKRRRGGEGERKRSELRKDIAGLRITRSSRFVRVEGNKVSRFHRQTRSTGNGSLASSIKRVTYRGEGRRTLEGPPEKLAAGTPRWPQSQDVTRRSWNRVGPEIRQKQGTRGRVLSNRLCKKQRSSIALRDTHIF